MNTGTPNPRVPLRTVPYRSVYPLSSTRVYRPISNVHSIHRIASVEPEVIDIEAENSNPVRAAPTRLYTNYSINGNGISRPRFAMPIQRRVPFTNQGYSRLPLRRPIYRAYHSNAPIVRGSAVIPYRPRTTTIRKPLEFEDYEEEAISAAIRHEEARMQQERGSYCYSDPYYQRFEARLAKNHGSTIEQIERQRLAKSTYQSNISASDVNNEKVKAIAQRMLNAPSPLATLSTDSEEQQMLKSTLKEVVDEVCALDRKYGWHRDILQKTRGNPELTVLHSQPATRRVQPKHHEVLLNEEVERMKRFINKTRAQFELSVELESGFIKRTRNGGLSCLPCNQIYNRIVVFGHRSAAQLLRAALTHTRLRVLCVPFRCCRSL